MPRTVRISCTQYDGAPVPEKYASGPPKFCANAPTHGLKAGLGWPAGRLVLSAVTKSGAGVTVSVPGT